MKGKGKGKEKEREWKRKGKGKVREKRKTVVSGLGILTVYWGKWIRKPMYYTVVTALIIEAWEKITMRRSTMLALKERYFSRREELEKGMG